jgi:hypothetical protein
LYENERGRGGGGEKGGGGGRERPHLYFGRTKATKRLEVQSADYDKYTSLVVYGHAYILVSSIRTRIYTSLVVYGHAYILV